MCTLIDTTAIGYERSKSWKAAAIRLSYHHLLLLPGGGVNICDECLPNPFTVLEFFCPVFS